MRVLFLLAALPLCAIACASTNETNEVAAEQTANISADATTWDGIACDGDAVRVEALHALRVAAGASDTLGQWNARLRYQDCDSTNGCGEWHEDSANASGAEGSDLTGTATLVPHPQLVGTPTFTIGLTSDTTCKLPGAGSPTYRYAGSISTDWDVTQIGRLTVPRSRSDYPIDCRAVELPLWQQGAENKVTDHCFRVRTWGQRNIVDAHSWRAYEAVVTASW